MLGIAHINNNNNNNNNNNTTTMPTKNQTSGKDSHRRILPGPYLFKETLILIISNKTESGRNKFSIGTVWQYVYLVRHVSYRSLNIFYLQGTLNVCWQRGSHREPHGIVYTLLAFVFEAFVP
jgi:hypothetical protein